MVLSLCLMAESLRSAVACRCLLAALCSLGPGSGSGCGSPGVQASASLGPESRLVLGTTVRASEEVRQPW